jgi:hypothetical protein
MLTHIMLYRDIRKEMVCPNGIPMMPIGMIQYGNVKSTPTRISIFIFSETKQLTTNRKQPMKFATYTSRKITNEPKAPLADIDYGYAKGFSHGVTYTVSKTIKHSNKVTQFWAAMEIKRQYERKIARRAKYNN